MKDVLPLYKNLPDEYDPEITILLRNIVINVGMDDITKHFLPYLDNKAVKEITRFYIYYSVSIYYRRYEHHRKFCELVNKYSTEFSKHPLNYVVLSLYHKFRAIDNSRVEYLRYALENAAKAVSLLPSNSGVANNYAELIADAIDEKYPIPNEKVLEAIDLLNQIISLNGSYAKWHYTKAKLLFSIKEYNEAKECIRTAIDLETADNKDSLLRIAKYNNTLLDFRTNETIEKLEQSLKDAKGEIIQINNEQDNKARTFFAELDDVKSKYLEFLAFFASIIAFVVASINIVTTYGEAVIAGGLIVILAGALSAAFCIFRLLISYNQKAGKGVVILSAVLSCVLMIAGFLICIVVR